MTSVDDEPPNLVYLERVPSASRFDLREVPVTILTGFLGSGKTTLLNHILNFHHGKKIAVVENEFSEGLGIEKLIAMNGVDGSDMTGFFELNNGCLCCTVKGTLTRTIEQLLDHKTKPCNFLDIVGVANPGPIISELWTDDRFDATPQNGIEKSIRLDGVITLIDSLNIEVCLKSKDSRNDILMQLAYADRILLNKSDLIDNNKKVKIEAFVRSINSVADVLHTTFSDVSPDWVLDIRGYALDSMDIINATCLTCTDPTKNQKYPSVQTPPCIQGPLHQNNLSIFSFPTTGTHSAQYFTTNSFSIPGNLNLQKLRVFIDRLLFNNGNAPSTHQAAYTAAVVAGVVTGLESSEASGRRRTRDDLSDEILQSHPGEEKDLLEDGSQLREENNHFFSQQESEIKSMQIYRIKGIFRIASDPMLYILQGVHEIFDIERSSIVKGGDKDNTNGMNNFVIIGRSIDRNYIEENIKNCGEII